MLLLQPGAETDWLLAEASRRIRVLAHAARPACPGPDRGRSGDAGRPRPARRRPG
jgi:hypothetical protein